MPLLARRFRRLFSALALLGLPAVAPAQTWQPTAAGTYSWNVPANWSPTTVPDSAAAAANVNIDFAGDQTIELNELIDLNSLAIGDTTADGGGLFNAVGVAVGTGGSLQFNGTATLTSANGANTISAPITLLGGLTVSHANAAGATGGLNLAGPVNLGSNTLTVLTTGNSTGAIDRGVTISGVVSGAGGLTKNNGNFLVLTGVNTYTGATTITGGAIRVAGGGDIGTGNLSLTGGQFFPEGTFIRPLGTGPGQVQLAGTVGFSTIGQDLTLNFGGAGAQVVWGSGGFTNGTFLLNSASGTGTVNVENPIQLTTPPTGQDRVFQVDNGSAAVDARLNGVISGTAGLAKTGNGRLELPIANTYTGRTLTGAGGAVRVLHPDALGAVTSPTVIQGGAGSSRLDLFGGITLAEPIQIEGRNVGNANVALVSEAGANTLTGTIVFNGGGNEYNIAAATGASFVIAGTITNGQTTSFRNLNFSGGGDGLVTGVISSTGTGVPINLFKNGGAGTWTLGGPNPHTYTGPTSVSAGRLLVDGTLSAVAAGVAVNTGGTFGGLGTVNRPITVATAGVLAAGGGGAGVLTATAGVTFQSGGVFGVRVVGGSPSPTPGGSTDSPSAPTTNNVLAITGGLTADPLTLTVRVDGTGTAFTPDVSYSYLIARSPGQDLSGVTTSDPGRFQFVGFDATGPLLSGTAGGDLFVTFTPVPEPTGLVAAGAFGLAVAVARRRAAARVGGSAG